MAQRSRRIAAEVASAKRRKLDAAPAPADDKSGGTGAGGEFGDEFIAF